MPQIGYAPTVVREVTGTIGEVTRTIVVDSDVFQDEQVTTGPNSATRLIFKDGTNLVMGENSKLKLTKLIFDPDPSKSKVAVDATLGIFRWTSGTLPSKSYQISTPVSTIGVRGTVFEFSVIGIGTTVVGVSQGAVDVTNLRNQSVLLHPGQATIVRAAGVGEEPPPPTPPGPPPTDFVEAARQMTIMVRMADPPSDVNPAAGPGGGQPPALPIGFGNGPGGGGNHQPDGFGGQHSPGSFAGFDAFARTLTSPGGSTQTSNNNNNNGGGPGTPGNPGNNNNGPGDSDPPGDSGKVIAINKVATTNPPATRIGTQSNGTVTVSRSASSDPGNQDLGRLKGTVDGASGVFTGAGSGPGGVDLGIGEQASFNYVFIPVAHGQGSVAIPFNFTDSLGGAPLAGTAQLTGVGVGPQFASSIPDTGLNFGTFAGGTAASQGITLTNATTDQGDRSLVGLTLLGYEIVGKWAGLFTLDGFVPGTVLDAGETLQLLLTYNAPLDEGFFDDASLIFHTDQGAAFGSLGESFSFALSGGTTPVPEPPSAAPFGLALAGIVGLRLRFRRGGHPR